ncbi:MAG: 4Fe-4S dicluster domain-containing protein [bacterium]
MANREARGDGLTRWKVRDLVFRVEGAAPGDFIVYDRRKCSGCGRCALVCAASLWSVRDHGKASLSPRYRDFCLECAACYAVCDQDAIDFRYPDGGSGIIIRHG